MSANSVLPEGQVSHPVFAKDVEGLVAGSIDPFDVASHLEAQGLNDGAARQLGHQDVFDFAHHLHDSAQRPVHSRPQLRAGEVLEAFGAATWQSILRLTPILAGVLLCYMIGKDHAWGPTVMHMPLSVAIGSAGCWLISHITAAAMWHDINQGPEHPVGGSAWVVAAMAAGSAVTVGAFSPSTSLWLAWGFAIGVLAPCFEGWRLSAITATTALLPAISIQLGFGKYAGIFAGAVVICWVGLALFFIGRAVPTKQTAMTPELGRDLVTAFAQAGGQIAMLGALLTLVPTSGVIAAAASALVASAATDPILSIGNTRASMVSHTSYRTVLARLQLTLISYAKVAIVAAVSTATALALNGGQESIALSVCSGCIALAVNSQLRQGRGGAAAWTAILGAVPAIGLAVAANEGLLNPTIGALVAAGLIVVMCAARLHRSMGRPTGWL